jgi:hypothetical protein
MEEKWTSVIKEFYNTVAFLLNYEANDETVGAEKAILGLICEIRDCRGNEAMLWDRIEEARCIQVCSDETIARSLIPSFSRNVAMTLRMDALQANNIDRIRMFNIHAFTDEIRECADLGNRVACKLLAALYWIGSLLPKNRQVALKIWSTLAASGDTDAIRTLVYAYDEEKNTEESQKWRNVLGILLAQYESFSPVALASDYKEYTSEEIHLANLISFIRQSGGSRDTGMIDRPMMHYVLESKEDYEFKMKRIATDTNYYLVMKMNDQYMGKKFGF